jgi:hypothetical protein
MDLRAPNRRCSVDGTDIVSNWIRMRMFDPRVEVDWQLESGVCITCHIARYHAAIEYERAADELRTLRMLGAQTKGRGKNGPGAQALTAATNRMKTADERCVSLKMWPATRAPRGSETT